MAQLEVQRPTRQTDQCRMDVQFVLRGQFEYRSAARDDQAAVHVEREFPQRQAVAPHLPRAGRPLQQGALGGERKHAAGRRYFQICNGAVGHIPVAHFLQTGTVETVHAARRPQPDSPGSVRRQNSHTQVPWPAAEFIATLANQAGIASLRRQRPCRERSAETQGDPHQDARARRGQWLQATNGHGITPRAHGYPCSHFTGTRPRMKQREPHRVSTNHTGARPR